VRGATFDDLKAAVESVAIAASKELAWWATFDAAPSSETTHDGWKESVEELAAARGNVFAALECLTGIEWRSA
jgi:hypothetical protein